MVAEHRDFGVVAARRLQERADRLVERLVDLQEATPLFALETLSGRRGDAGS